MYRRFNKINGAISLFSAMIFLVIASVITASIHSAKIHAAAVMVGTSTNLALDSVFAGYNSKLFDKFGVLSFDGSGGGVFVDEDKISAEISSYLTNNLNTSAHSLFTGAKDIYGINVKGVMVNDVLALTDGNGLLWYDSVVEYEKYAKVVDLAASYLKINEESDKYKAVKKINDDIVACTSEIAEVNKKARAIIEYVDGVVCPVKGMNFRNLSTVKSFIKVFCPYEITAQNSRINKSEVFNKVSPFMKNPLAMIDDAKKYLSEKRTAKFKTELNNIKKLAETSLSCIEKALNSIGDVTTETQKLDAAISRLSDTVQAQKNVIDADTISGLSEEVDGLKNYKEVLVEEICDMPALSITLSADKNVLERLIEQIGKTDPYATVDKVLANLNSLVETISLFSLNNVQINYEHLGSNAQNTSILSNLSKALEDGALGLVVPNGRSLSKREFKKYAGMASEVCDYNGANALQLGENVAIRSGKRVIYSEYVGDNFASFLDNRNGPMLDYEMEYIIFGDKKDSSNLMKTVLAIAGMRSGTNYMYILTDAQKKEEAYALATLIAGASGIDAVIRLTQYSLLYLWAYAEGLADVKILLDGGKVGVTKTKDTWNISLENLLANNFNVTKENGTRQGLSYEMFLKALLTLENDGKKSAYTMDLVETYMIAMGQTNFRCMKQIYGIDVDIAYTVAGATGWYDYRTAYKY